MLDNQDPVQENLDQESTEVNSDDLDTSVNYEPQEGTATEVMPDKDRGIFNWKARLGEDLRNSPVMQKFSDDADGFSKLAESHHNLEKLLGHEKVPIPKGPEDIEGWGRFSKAMGIPEVPTGYALDDVNAPEEIKGQMYSKEKFAELSHRLKLTPSQAKDLWKEYNAVTTDQYSNAVRGLTAKVEELRNSLKQEWGDSYTANVDLAQSVISKFAGTKEVEQSLSAKLLQDPEAIRVFAKIGNEFAENKIEGFQYKKFSLSLAEAQAEIDAIVTNENHPYNNGKAPSEERTRAINYVNGLYAIVQRGKAK